MNNANLQLASDASKMIILLGRGILDQAEASKLRSRVDDAVYRLVRLGQLNASTPEKLEVEIFIKNIHAALVREMALLNVDTLVNKKVGYGLKNAMATTLTDVAMVRTIFNRLNLVPEPQTPGFDRAHPGVAEATKRGQILNIFGSIVRNDEWMSLMLLLNAPHPVKLNTILTQEYSSGQGRDQREAKVASLVSETKPVGIKASLDVLTISAALTPKVAVQHAKVAPLFSALMVDPANADAINKLLGEATRAEEVVLADVPAFVQRRLDALVKGLTQQKKVHETETKAKREAVERKKEDDAVQALQGMGAHLSVLASNPALLARALQAAGLAPQEAGAKVARALRAPIKAAKASASKPAVKTASSRVNARRKS